MRGHEKRLEAPVPALLLLALLLGAGCAGRPAAGPATVASAPACREVEGLAPLIAPGAGLLLGEMHGTVESPAFVANAACLALAAGHPVTVALELPRDERGRVDAFLASAGAGADRDALLDSPFWRHEVQDGRRSEAMLALFEELRRLGRQRPLRVALLDRFEPPRSTAEREGWMAAALAAAFDETPGAVVIALAGNLHTRVGRGSPWDPEYEPAGYLLARQRPELALTALDVAYRGGTAWTCTSGEPESCRARTLRGRAEAGSGRVTLHPEVTRGYHGVYEVGDLTASPPAWRSGRPDAPRPRSPG
jgi:hypothetical protein